MWQYMFSMPVMRTVWRRELDWMLFVRECMLWLPSEIITIQEILRNNFYFPKITNNQIEKNEMGWACSTYGRREVYTGLWLGTTWKTQA